MRRIAERVASFPYLQPVDPAQRATPPLFVSLARAWNAAGDPAAALTVLERELGAGKLDRPATAAALGAKAEVILRHRLRDRAQAFAETLRSADVPGREELIRQVEALRGSEPAPAQAKAREPASGSVRTLQTVLGFVLMGAMAIGVVALGRWLFGEYSFRVHQTAGHTVALGWRWAILFGCAAVVYGLVLMLRPVLRAAGSSLARWPELMEAAAWICLEVRPAAAARASPPPSRDAYQAEARLLTRRVAPGPALALLVKFSAVAYFEAIKTLGKTPWRQYHGEAVFRAMLSRFKEASANWVIQFSVDGTELGSPAPASAGQVQAQPPTPPPATDDVAAELRDVFQRAGQNAVRVAVETQPEVAGRDWESGLAGLLGDAPGGPARLLAFRLQPPWSGTERHYDWQTEVRILADPKWERAYRAIWKEDRRSWWSRIWSRRMTLAPADAAGSAGRVPRFRICHLIGSAHPARTGVWLTFGRAEDEQKSSSNPIGAEQFAREEVGLMAVQETPSPLGPRSLTERERTAALRRFADELFRCGAWAVLLVPVLPPALARQVVSQVADRLRSSQPPGLGPLLGLSDEVRRTIRAASSAPTDGPLADLSPEQVQKIFSELAWEVTLFARSRAHASLAETTSTPAAQTARHAATNLITNRMSIWDSIAKWFQDNATHMQHLTFADPNTTIPAIQPNVHYFRLWLCEMFLTDSRKWFRNLYPLVSSQVQLRFANQNAATFSRVASPPKEQLGPGVYRDYHLTELMPFNGGTVEVQTALLALRSESSLLSAIKVLEGFSQLVTAPLAQVLSVASQVTSGLDQMFAAANGQVHLGFQQTYVSGGGGGTNDLKPGYIAVIAATERQLPPAELTIQNGQLCRAGAGLTGFDYVLFRIEARARPLRDVAGLPEITSAEAFG